MKILRFVTELFQENCYLLYDPDGKEAVLIDPGGRHQEIIRFLETRKLDLKAILSTHCHADHIFAVHRIQESFEVPFYYHSNDREYLQRLPEQAMLLGLGVTAIPDNQVVLRDAEELRFGSLQLKVIHTPGHTQGSVVFQSDKILFTGDTLFAGSIGRTDLPGGDLETLMRSIREKLIQFPPETVIMPGHGEQSTVGEELLTNPFLNENYPLM